MKLKWPWLGIAIPSSLIAFIGYGSHYFILGNFLSLGQQVWFQICLSMIWISYALAIFTNPGKPPTGFQPLPHQWKNICQKCKTYKPERTHHCKTCDQCVLVMDHHCPWTMNCVGHNNFPHFVRFLVWVIITTSYLGFMLWKRIFMHWQLRHTRIYVQKIELVFIFINTPLNAFVWLTIILLLLRCSKNQFLCGMTQIERWEWERIENQFNNGRLIPQLLENLAEIYGDDILNSPNAKKLINARDLQLEEIVNFPYDLNIVANTRHAIGNLLTCILPWSSPVGNGLKFTKNDLSSYDTCHTIEDKLLSLPWPPDGGRQQPTGDSQVSSRIEMHSSRGEPVLRKRLRDPRINMQRTEWYNDWGENLSDFGVDVESETVPDANK